MYEIFLSEEAKKQLVHLDNATQERIGVALERIKIRPHDFVKRMYNGKYYRVRVDNYRIILDIQDTLLMIYVIHVDTKDKIYKK